MSISKCCDNCVHNDYINLYGIEYLCCESFYGKEDLSKCYDFAPKEEVVREDERRKTIKDIYNYFYISAEEISKKVMDTNGMAK